MTDELPPPPASPRSIAATNNALAAYRAKHHQAYIERKKREVLAAGATTVKPTTTTTTSTSSRPTPNHLQPAPSSVTPIEPDRPTVVTKRIVQRTKADTHGTSSESQGAAASSSRSNSSSPPPSVLPRLSPQPIPSLPTKTIVYEATNLSSMPPRKSPVPLKTTTTTSNLSSLKRLNGPSSSLPSMSTGGTGGHSGTAAAGEDIGTRLPASSSSHTLMSALKKTARAAPVTAEGAGWR